MRQAGSDTAIVIILRNSFFKLHIMSTGQLYTKFLFELIRSKYIKGSKECLFIRTQTHNLQIFGVILFVKLQKDT